MTRRRKYCTKFSCAILSLVLLANLVIMLAFRNRLKDDAFLELDTCPACFGVSYCQPLLSGDVLFAGWHRITALHGLSVKNVFYAQQKKDRLVLKKLAHTNELTIINRRICESAKMGKHCDVREGLFRSQYMKAISNTGLVADQLSGLSDMVQCPSQRLVDRMWLRYTEKISSTKRTSVIEEKLMLITTLMTNPEPIIMQTFPANEGWPFPEYLGACGRYVVEEYGGKTLTDYYGNAPWRKRVEIAHQLLEIADELTSNDSEFSLYLTDLSYDNIVINTDGRVIIAVMENIVVVDKEKIRREKPARFTDPLVSAFDECRTGSNCVSFSPDDLCSRLNADHNYYTVCRNILSQYATQSGSPNGLLFDIPARVNQKYGLESLVNECVKPTKPNGRMAIKDRLIGVLARLNLEYGDSATSNLSH